MKKEYIKKFNSMKSEQDKENIKNIVDDFLANKEITKEEYNNLIKYYKGTCLIDFLKYDTYKITKYIHMNEQEQKLHSIILRSCFILNY